MSGDPLQRLHSQGTLLLGCCNSPDLHICSFLTKTSENGSSVIKNIVLGGVFCVYIHKTLTLASVITSAGASTFGIEWCAKSQRCQLYPNLMYLPLPWTTVIRTLEEEPDFFQVWIEAFPKGSRERWEKKEAKSQDRLGDVRVKRNLQLGLLSRETGKP